MNGKMQALEALLEMLSKMDLEKMKPQDGELKVEMELGDENVAKGLGEESSQADELIRKQMGEEPLLEGKPLEEGGTPEDEEELKKLYSALD